MQFLIPHSPTCPSWHTQKKKWVAFFCTKDKQAEKEIRETSPFTIATNNIKHFGHSSNKASMIRMARTSNLWRKKLRKKSRKWNYFLCSWMNSEKDDLTESNLQIHAIPIKILTQFFTNLEKAILNCISKNKRPKIAKFLNNK